MPDVASLVMAVDSRPVDQAVRSLADLERQGQRTEAAVDGVSNSGQGLRRVGAEADSAGRSMQFLANAAKTAMGAISVRAIAGLADAWGQVNSRLKIAVKDTQDFAMVQSELMRVANTAYTSYDRLAGAFANSSNSLSQLGLSMREQIKLQEALLNASVVSGANDEMRARAMQAFNNALAAGVLRGQEWITIMQTSPRVVGLLGDALGKTELQISAMAKNGGIAIQDLLDALIGGADKVSQEVEAMPVAFADALVRLRNSAMQTIGVFDDTNKVSVRLTDSINVLSNNFDLVAAGATALGAIHISRWFLSAADAAIKADVTFKAIAASGDRLEIMGARVGTSMRLLAGGFMSLVGGPVGLLTLAVGAGYLAWEHYSNRADQAREALDLLGPSADTAREAIEKLTASQITLARSSAQNDLTEAVKKIREAIESAAAPIPDIRDRLEAGAIGEIRQAFKDLADDTTLSAREVNQRLQSLIDSMAASGRLSAEHAKSFTSWAKALYDAQSNAKLAQDRIDALAKAQSGAAQAADALAASQLKQAAAAAQAAAGMDPDKWEKYVKNLREAADTVGMSARQMAEYQARAAGASDAQARLAGVLATVESTAKELQKATADKDAKAIQGAKDTLTQLVAQEAQLRANIATATTYADLLRRGFGLTEANRLANATGDQAYTDSFEAGMKRLNSLFTNIANNTAPSKAAAKAAKDAARAYDDLAKSIDDYIAQNKIALALGDNTSKADQLRAQYQRALADGTAKLTAAERASIEIKLKNASASEQLLNLEQVRLATQKKQTDVSAQAVRSLRDEVDKNKDLIRTFGLAASSIEEMTAARLEDELARARGNNATQDEIAGYEALIALRRENAGLLREREIQDADLKAWESWQQSVGQIFDQVGQSLTDAIFEGGKSGRDLIKDLFKALTLRVLIQPVMGALQGAVTQQLGSAFGYTNPAQQYGAAAQPGSGFDFNSLVGQGAGGSLTSFGSAIGSQMVTEFGAGLTAGAGGALSAAQATALMNIGTEGSSSFAAGSAAGGAGLGSMLGYAGAAYALTQGQYGSAAGMAIGTAIAPGIGTAIGGMLGSLADGIFGGDGKPQTTHSQSTGFTADDSGIRQGAFDDRVGGDIVTAIRDMTAATRTDVNALFAAVGSDAYIQQLDARARTTVQGRNATGALGVLTNGGATRNVGEGFALGFDDLNAGDNIVASMQADLQRFALTALQSVMGDLPQFAQDMLTGQDVFAQSDEAVAQLYTTLTGLITGAQQLQQAMEGLPFENLKGLTLDAAAGLLQFAGSLENLQQLQSSYIDQFYSDAEKQALQIESIGKVLSAVGVDMPAVTDSADDMRAAWRALVEAQDINTEAGQRAYVALLSVSGAFATVASSAQAAAQAAAQARVQQTQQLQQTGQDALSALQAAVNAQKSSINAMSQAQQSAIQSSITTAQSAVSSLTNLTGKLQSALNSMAGQISPAATFGWAQDRLDRALSVAKLTGQMPEGAEFDAALAAAQKPDPALFDSFEDFQAAQLKSANLIADLNDVSGGQLTTAQRQLSVLQSQLDQSKASAASQISRLDSIFANAQEQLNAALGTEAGVLSIPDALAQLADSIRGINIDKGKNGATGAAFDEGAYLNAKVDALLRDGNLPADFVGAVTAASVKAYMQAVGMSPLEHYKKYGQFENIPGFAVGTNSVPFDMTARVHAGERIIPAADNRALMQALSSRGSGDSGLRAEIQELRAENREQAQAIQALMAEVARNTKRGADSADQMINGGVSVRADRPLPVAKVVDMTT